MPADILEKVGQPIEADSVAEGDQLRTVDSLANQPELEAREENDNITPAGKRRAEYATRQATRSGD